MQFLEYPVMLNFVRDFCVQQILFALFTTEAMVTLTQQPMLIQVPRDLTFFSLATMAPEKEIKTP